MCVKSAMSLSVVVVLGILSAGGLADPSLVAWYQFDGNAADSSGGGYDGTIVGNPEWVDGELGGALNFNGSTCVDVPPQTWASITTQVTVAFWAGMVKVVVVELALANEPADAAQ